MRPIEFEMELAAPIQRVWEAWTTAHGVQTFLAPACNIDLRPGGDYEIFFYPEGEPGHRGADGNFVLAFQEPSLFSFTWNAPETLPTVRAQLSHVTLRLQAMDNQRTQMHFREDGYGQGGEWEKRREYFVSAWGQVVLPRLAYSLAEGPVDWSADTLDVSQYQNLIKEL